MSAGERADGAAAARPVPDTAEALRHLALKMTPAQPRRDSAGSTQNHALRRTAIARVEGFGVVDEVRQTIAGLLDAGIERGTDRILGFD